MPFKFVYSWIGIGSKFAVEINDDLFGRTFLIPDWSVLTIASYTHSFVQSFRENRIILFQLNSERNCQQKLWLYPIMATVISLWGTVYAVRKGLQYLCNTNNDRLSRAEGARSYTIYTGVCLKHLEILIVLVVIVDFFAPAALITYSNLRILGICSFFLKFLTSEKKLLKFLNLGDTPPPLGGVRYGMTLFPGILRT